MCPCAQTGQAGRHVLGALVAASVVLSLAPRAAASGPGPRARLRYARLAGAESCPAQPAFEAEVAAWLGYDPFSDSSPRSVVIDLSRDDSGLGAHLRLEDRAGRSLGERQISTASPDCRDLTQALVLAVALAVDLLPNSRDVIGPGELAATPSTSPAQPSATANVQRAQPPTTRAVVTASLGGSLWLAAGPEPAPGIVAGVDVRFDHFSIGLDAQADYPTHKAWPPGSIGVSLLAAEVLPCYRLGIFGACVVLAIGAELGRGENLNQAEDEPLPYLGVGGRLLAEIPIGGPLAIRVQVDALATALGASYYVGTSDVWNTPPVALEAAATLAWRL
jgi:hypothetical protein